VQRLQLDGVSKTDSGNESAGTKTLGTELRPGAQMRSPFCLQKSEFFFTVQYSSFCEDPGTRNVLQKIF